MPDNPQPERIRLSLGPLTMGREVVLIRAGKANGLNFSEACLSAAVPLFADRPSFVNHEGFFEWGRSVNDLAGHLSNPRWDPDQRAVMAEYLWYSQAEKLKTLAQEAADKKYFGLSAVLYITRNGADVQAITAVDSVDIVINPAAGGSFQPAAEAELSTGARPCAPTAKETTMPPEQAAESTQQTAPPAPETPAPAPVIQTAAPIEDLAAIRLELARMKITQSGLPQNLQDRLLARLATTPAYLPHVDDDIQMFRELAGELTARDAIRGLGASPRVGADGLDRITLAFEKLMGLEVPGQVERLSGIREMYDLLTGDWERRGIFQPERVRFSAAVTTSTMTHVVANVLNKVMLRSFSLRPQWWKPVVTEQDFPTMQDPKWITLAGFGDLSTVAEGGSYTELTWTDNNETASFTKKGGYVGITLEMIDKDDVAAVRTIPRRLGLAAARTLSAAIASLLTTNAALHDGHELFDADHSNVGSAALSADNWDAVIQAMFAQHELGSSKHLGIRPRYVLVPIELEKTALTIFSSDREPGTSDNDANVRRMSDAVITVPEFTTANHWYAAADPLDLEGIMVGYRFGRQPELFVADNELMGSMFTNDEMRIKVRFVFVVGIGDYRALYAQLP